MSYFEYYIYMILLLRSYVILSVLDVAVCFIFFNQNTAYVLRISDWSSDVCSSDPAHRDVVDLARQCYRPRNGAAVGNRFAQVHEPAALARELEIGIDGPGGGQGALVVAGRGGAGQPGGAGVCGHQRRPELDPRIGGRARGVGGEGGAAGAEDGGGGVIK